MRFEILGRRGKWHLESFEGIEEPARTSGSVPGEVDARPTTPNARIVLRMSYVGEAVTSRFGEVTRAGTPVHFEFDDIMPEARR